MLYGGEGADELFQGYEAYKKLENVGVPAGSFSPYSSIESSTKLGIPKDYSRDFDDEYIKCF